MNLVHLVTAYGYWAIVIGTFLEGETILVLAGLAAHRGYLALPWVMVAAFAGSLAGDQFFFHLGRRHSAWALRRFRSLRGRLDRAEAMLHDYRVPFMVGFRFLYGLRTVTPFAIGMSRVNAWEFTACNVVGAALWSVAVGGGGYLFGSAMQALITDLKRYELLLFGLLALAGVGLWLLRRRRR